MKGKKGLLKVGDVAAALGISVPHAYRIAATGELPSIRLGRKAVRFEAADVEAYIQAHRRQKAG